MLELSDATEFSFNELLIAYFSCRKNKRHTVNALKFEEHFEKNLIILYNELITKTYKPKTYLHFISTAPCYREVWASDFRDRIIHHLIYNRISNKYFNNFIFDSYACIPNKGTLAASKRLDHFIRACSNNFELPAYYLKCDIKNFFVSINKKVLLNVLKDNSIIVEANRQFGYSDYFLDLICIILNQNITGDYKFKGKDFRYKIPFFKRLINSKENCGLPIGNLTSQLFANIYLDVLDKYIKHVLKIKYYIRYVDDIIIIDNSPLDLESIYIRLKEFLLNLGLVFNENKTKTGQIDNIDFVGRIINRYYTKVRKRILKKLNNFNIDDYYGVLKHCNTYTIRKSYNSKY